MLKTILYFLLLAVCCALCYFKGSYDAHNKHRLLREQADRHLAMLLSKKRDTKEKD